MTGISPIIHKKWNKIVKRNLFTFILTVAAGILILASATAKNPGVPAFNPADFGTPRDNAYMPMAIGLTYVCSAEEWTELSPGEIEHKHYAPGVGLVYIGELKSRTVKVELIDIY